MDCPTRTRCAWLAWIASCLAGCASTRYEAPPEVVEQPPADVTTAEVVVEQREAAAVEEEHGAADTARADAQRYRPAGLSVTEVRSLNEAAAPPLDFGQRLDYGHDRLYAWTQGVVEATDRRFADKDKPLQPVPAAPFRLGVVGEWIDHNGGREVDLRAEFDIALRLPNLERRLRVFITSGTLDEAPRNERETEGLRAGLRYELLRFLDFDLGMKVNVPPVAFASLKWSREVDLGRWDFYPFAKIFAETKESVGYAAATTFDRWNGRHLLRSSTYAKWRADRNRTEWSQTLIYGRAHELLVPDRHGSYPRANDIGRGWGLRLLAGGETARSVDHYEAGIFFRHPTPNRWLYWSVEPLVRWDRQYNWSADSGIRIGIEALFWDLARPARR
jgi:hypothetical protein